MRGKGSVLGLRRVREGITPAYAGKSGLCVALRRSSWDHPRLCGEKEEFIMKKIDVEGSPPPMRGKGSLSCCAFDHIRITPAYAGKSRFQHSFVDFFGDHPRLCGEKYYDMQEKK